MISRIEFIEGQLRTLRLELADAEHDRNAYSLQAVDAAHALQVAADEANEAAKKQRAAELKKLEHDRDVLDAEVRDIQAKIARWERDKVNAAREDSIEFKRAVLAQSKELYRQIEQRSERMNELASEICTGLHSIAPKLGEISRLGTENHRDAWHIAKATVGAKEASAHIDGISHVARGAHLNPSLALALDASALVAILRPYYSVNFLPGSSGDPEYDAHRALEKLAGLVKRYEAEIALAERSERKAVS